MQIYVVRTLVLNYHLCMASHLDLGAIHRRHHCQQEKKDMSLSRLVATSRRPSLGHVVYTLVTVAMTDAEFKLNMYENFEN